MRDLRVFVYRVVVFLTLLFLSKQLVLSQKWNNITPITGSVLIAGRLPICCNNIIPLLGADKKPMSQVPIANDYWPNISRQDIANVNNANENPTLIPMWLDKRTPTSISAMRNQRWTNIFILSDYPILT